MATGQDMNLRLERTIGIGPLLTSASILISALGLVYQLSKDNATKQLQQANEVRAAAARTWESLDRWREISFFIFDELQPSFVQASVELARSQNKILARDNLYKEIMAIRLRKLHELQAERIFVSYVPMYKFNPSIKPYFESVIKELRTLDLEMTDAVLEQTQSDVLSADEKTKTTALLGNKLRESAGRIRNDYEKKIDMVLLPPDRFLSNLIRLPDAKLLDPENLAAPGVR